MFEKSLTDLIRGIRANKKNEEAYINQALDEIRGEVRRNDPDIKAVAVAKLFYLHMHGYDMSWASFHVVEVMSSSKFTHKRIGYIAAAISFKQDTDVLMLCTNLIKKDLSSNNFLETALALNGLCTIVTPDLGRDLAPDLIAMLNHSRPYIRKRVLLCLYKVFLKYPEALRVAFPRLKDKLDDSDPSVVSSAVNVICELARKNPKSYLNLAPQLYNLLTNSSNNWMLIKIVKLFGALTPLEPRLIKKLVPPITSLIQSTTAMSLLYECIHTVITGQMISPETPGSDSEDNQDTALARLCVSKLQLFVEDADQNLKYLGLFALCKLLPLRPRAVTEHRDTILECLDDKDISIRMRALELISGMVTKKNVIDIVKKLMLQVTPLSESKDSRANASASLFAASENNYSLEVVSRILQFCSRNTYELITDFEWYVAALARLVHVPRISVGTEISSQLIDVAVRVKEVRPFAVAQMVNLLSDTSIIESSSLEVNNVEALFAAGWICGEFNESLADPLELLDILTAPNISKLPGRIQAVYLHASFKIYSSWVHRSVHMAEDPFKENTAMLQGRYHKFSTSEDLEVQERASISYQLLNLVDVKTSVEEWTVPKLALELSSLFDGELNPVGPRAQKKVPLPEGLDLDKYIYEPEVEPANEVDVPDDSDADDGLFRELTSSRNGDRIVEEDDRRRTESRRERRDRLKGDPFYISNDSEIDAIPIVKLEFDDGANGISTGKSSKSKKTGSKKSKKLADPFNVQTPKTTFSINRGSEMPEGVEGDDEENEIMRGKKSRPLDFDQDTLAVLSVDLTEDVSNSSANSSKLHFEVGRATILSSHAPSSAQSVVSVTRKKVDDTKKKKTSGESGTDKKKKSKSSKKTDGDLVLIEDSPSVKLPKKKKAASGESRSKKKAVVAPPPGPPPDASGFEEVKLVDIEDVSPMQPASAFASFTPKEIVSSSTHRTIVEQDGVTVGFDWLVHGPPNQGVASASITLTIGNVAETSLTHVSASIDPSGPITCVPITPSPLIELLASTYDKFDFLILIPCRAPEFVSPIILKGVLKWTKESQDMQHAFEFTLPALLNLLPPSASLIDPTSFSTLLSGTEHFPFSASVHFPVPAMDQFGDIVTTQLVPQLRLQIVEAVNGAVSVYGRSLHGKHIAGLMKVRPKISKSGAVKTVTDASAGPGIVSVELKGGDKALIDALMEAVNEFEIQ